MCKAIEREYGRVLVKKKIARGVRVALILHVVSRHDWSIA